MEGWIPAETLTQIRDAPRLSDTVYVALREAVVSGRIPPGSRLREDELAQQMNVSRITARTSLQRLMADGLAVQEPYKGVRVTLLPLEELEEVYEMRASLEGLAMKHAARLISADDLRSMRELLPLASDYGPTSPMPEVRLTNREFHWLAIRACGLRRLIRTLTQLWDLSSTYLLASSGPEDVVGGASHSDRIDHTQILEALSNRDERAARRAAEAHVERAWQILNQALRLSCR